MTTVAESAQRTFATFTDELSPPQLPPAGLMAAGGTGGTGVVRPPGTACSGTGSTGGCTTGTN